MTPRAIRIDGDVAYVPLTKGYEAVIDSADVTLVDGVSWRAMVSPSGRVYATTWSQDGKRDLLFLHRVIENTDAGLDTDHIDGNGLNNRRANLRVATRSQNRCNTGKPCTNTSGFKGVSWHKHAQKWCASIGFNGKRRSLGHHDSPEAAHAAYVKAAAELHGEFARVA